MCNKNNNTYTLFMFIVSLFVTMPSHVLAQDTDSSMINTDDKLPLQDIHTFVEVFHQIKNHYVNEVSDEELLEFAIDGMLQGLDPHSTYLNQSDYSELQESTRGEFAGIGLEVSMENGFLKVISPIDDTPASNAGILSGDVIIKLNGQVIKGLNLNAAIELMRGPKNSKISLTILRDQTEKPIHLELERAIIRIQSVKSELLGNDFAYLRIAQFQQDTAKETQKHIHKMIKANKSPLKGLLIDLRNNPGGVLSAAIAVCDTFLNEGLIVYTEGRSGNNQEKFHASETQLLADKPIIVLMNQGSASASEIVAGALQDHKRALIVGTQSFGKGSVQSILPLAKDRGMKLTTARYYTPLGRSIQASGIQPDIEIKAAKLTPNSEEFGISEAELSGHLQNKKKATAAKNEASRSLLDDYQLHAALNLLKALSFNQ